MGMLDAVTNMNVVITGYLTAVNILVVNDGSIEGHHYVYLCILQVKNQII